MKIKRLFMRYLGLHSTLLVAVVFIIFSIAVILNRIEDAKSDAISLAHTAADMIDGETAMNYALEPVADDAYFETQKKLQKLKLNYSDCVFLYVYAPVSEDHATYIYDIYNDRDNIPEEDQGYLGYEENWDMLEGGHEIYRTGGESKKLEFSPFSEYGSLFSYSAPVYNSEGRVTAIVGIDYSFSDFVIFIAVVLISVLVLVIVTAILLNLYEVKLIDKNIIKPIERIEEKTLAFAKSEHDGDSKQYMLEEVENSENELDILAVAINKMIGDTDDYIKNIAAITKERERIGAELDVAKRIQASALPCVFPPFPDRKEFDIFASMEPAKEVGGDFYDFFLVDEDHLGLVMADVSGKGVGAALFMMISKVLINNQAFYTKSPGEILTEVNARLCAGNEAEMFVTVWIGILEISTGIMRCANGGHEFPAIKRKNGKFELFKDKHGFVLGGMEGIKYKEYELQFNPGDTIFVYTDGVPEATNADNELFGTDRMIEALNKNVEGGCVDLLVNVREDIDAFVGEADQFDDITMMAVNYIGK